MRCREIARMRRPRARGCRVVGSVSPEDLARGVRVLARAKLVR